MYMYAVLCKYAFETKRLETQSLEKTRSGENDLNMRKMHVPNGTGPGVQKSTRPLYISQNVTKKKTNVPRFMFHVYWRTKERSQTNLLKLR